jgi:hypothetical protein
MLMDIAVLDIVLGEELEEERGETAKERISKGPTWV